MSYFIVMTFPVSEGEQVMFQPVLTPGLAAAERNSCLIWDAFCGGCLSRHSLRQLFLAPRAVSRRSWRITTAPPDPSSGVGSLRLTRAPWSL